MILGRKTHSRFLAEVARTNQEIFSHYGDVKELCLYKNWGTSPDGLIYYGNPALPEATIPPWTRLPGWNENNSLSGEGDQTNFFYQELLKEIEESN